MAMAPDALPKRFSRKFSRPVVLTHKVSVVTNTLRGRGCYSIRECSRQQTRTPSRVRRLTDTAPLGEAVVALALLQL